jgi:tetratricopeptide (TPR) repeat protein
MKTLKSQKRHAMARSGKSALGVGKAADRKRGIARTKVRSVRSEARVPLTSSQSKITSRGAISAAPRRPHADVPYQTAVRNFEVGVRAFQKQDYQKAAEIFEKLVDSDARDVAERAQMHLRLCRQRTGRPAAAPKSAEEYYALGVACLNARDLGHAIEHLSKADKLKPNQDHVQYALAVSHALGGNVDVAFAHLEAAFALRPENRFHARRDEDFQGLTSDPRFRRLIHASGN